MHKKIKVVFVMNNFLIGGVERLTFDIISSLDKDKYDIKIVTVLGSGPLENSFRNLGVPIYFAGTSHPVSKKLPLKLYLFLIDRITIVKITLFLIKSKPDIVISSLYQADVLGMTSAKIAGVKKRILIQHDTVKFIEFIPRVKKNFALRFSTQIVSVSETVKEFLIEYFKVKEEKITTIYNGINYESFKKGRREFPSEGMPVIGIIGRLEEIKGHIYALEAINIIQEKYNLHPTVLIGGDGSLRDSLEKYKVKHNLRSVKFLGSISNVPDFLSQVDVLIIPSISEGFCLVVLEGMVSGKVVIASDIQVMQELITDGKNGLLFKSQNASVLAEVLFKILVNQEAMQNLQHSALLFVEENRKLFDIQEVLKTYQNLLISK